MRIECGPVNAFHNTITEFQLSRLKQIQMKCLAPGITTLTIESIYIYILISIPLARKFNVFDQETGFTFKHFKNSVCLSVKISAII